MRFVVINNDERRALRMIASGLDFDCLTKTIFILEKHAPSETICLTFSDICDIVDQKHTEHRLCLYTTYRATSLLDG